MILAAYNNKCFVVQYLLRAGVDKTVRGQGGKTAADKARAQGHDALADCIDAFGTEHWQVVYVCVYVCACVCAVSDDDDR